MCPYFPLDVTVFLPILIISLFSRTIEICFLFVQGEEEVSLVTHVIKFLPYNLALLLL